MSCSTSLQPAGFILIFTSSSCTDDEALPGDDEDFVAGEGVAKALRVLESGGRLVDTQVILFVHFLFPVLAFSCVCGIQVWQRQCRSLRRMLQTMWPTCQEMRRR